MFSLKKIYNRVYLLEFDTEFELCMHFMRYQEYYENPKHMDEVVELPDIIKYYTNTFGDGVNFTYFDDWAGFNLPSHVIFELYDKIPDKNRYDRLMYNIAKNIYSDCDESFYLLGVKTGDRVVLDHELAHALFYINEEYRSEMIRLMANLDSNLFNQAKEVLLEAGYNAKVFDDEIQAYMATGLTEKLEEIGLEEYSEPFIIIFDKFKSEMNNNFDHE